MKIGDLKLNKKIGIFYDSTDNSDKISIKECIKNYSEFDYADKICLDLGANIGGFSAIALNKGAKKIIAVECDERNFEMLAYNLKANKKVKLILGAASNKNGKVKILKKLDSKQKNISVKIEDSVVRKNDSYQVVSEVNSYDIFELIDKYVPNVLKIDIEGAEFLCFANTKKKINKSVKELLIEVHLTKTNTLKKMDHLFKQFKTKKMKKHVSFGRVFGYDIYLKR